jgi:integrase
MKSGMRIGDVLHLKYGDLKERYEGKQIPLKIDLINDHGKEYYTYIDAEGVEYLRQYLEYREKLVGRNIQEDEYIFIAEYADPEQRLKPIDRDSVVRQFYETAKSKGLVTNHDNSMRSHKSEFKSHGFRHIFKTEAVRAGAELGIQRIDILIEFFMGHDKGVQEVYDHNSEIHPELFKNAYEKIGAYLSLDASKVDEARITQNTRTEMAKENQDLREQIQDLQAKMGEFETILKTKYA